MRGNLLQVLSGKREATPKKKLEPHYKQVNLNEIVQNMDKEEADFTGTFEAYQKNGKTYFQRPAENFDMPIKRMDKLICSSRAFIRTMNVSSPVCFGYNARTMCRCGLLKINLFMRINVRVRMIYHSKRDLAVEYS